MLEDVVVNIQSLNCEMQDIPKNDKSVFFSYTQSVALLRKVGAEYD